MSDFAYTLATPADDAAIRRLLRENPLPGSVSISYEREPNYFAGCGSMGSFCQTMIARAATDDPLVALMVRSGRKRFVNGLPQEVGYLGQLRVDAGSRREGIVSQGVDFLRELHADGRYESYLTSIIVGNTIAEHVLVERLRRYGLFFYGPQPFRTAALTVRRNVQPPKLPTSYTLRAGTNEDRESIVKAMNAFGWRRQFAPVYEPEDLDGLHAPRPQDFVVLCRDEALVGALAVWDQSAYKQSVVRSYRRPLNLVLPLYNAYRGLSGGVPLPLPGQPLRAAYAAGPGLRSDDPALFRMLVQGALAAAAQRGLAYLLIGLSPHDPLWPIVSAFPHMRYDSVVYIASFEDRQDVTARLDACIPYVEMALL